MRKILIKTRKDEIKAELYESRIARLIWENLPLEGRANIWGEEVYFEISVQAELEEGREIVSKGDIGYWPPGSSICIFFGPTPISQREEIRPASPVSIIGKVVDGLEALREVEEGEIISIEKMIL
jgi:hypothetical protein